MATQAYEPDDLAELVDRIRREAAAAGELPGAVTDLGSHLDRDVRDFLYSIIVDGTYAEAAAEVSRRDPDLATQ